MIPFATFDILLCLNSKLNLQYLMLLKTWQFMIIITGYFLKQAIKPSKFLNTLEEEFDILIPILQQRDLFTTKVAA